MFVALDRDGTLIKHVPYLVDPEHVQVDNSAALGIRKLNELAIPVVVITNQPVIGRGLASRERIDEIHARVDTKLATFGASIHKYFVCPHSADGECDCRKPKTRLVVEAATLLGLPSSSCVVIGDSWRDMQLAHRLGVPGLRVNTGPEIANNSSEKSFPDMLSAVEYLIQTII